MISKFLSDLRYERAKSKLLNALNLNLNSIKEFKEVMKDFVPEKLELKEVKNDLNIILNTMHSVALFKKDLYFAQKHIDSSQEVDEKSFFARILVLLIFEFLDDLGWLSSKNLIVVAQKYSHSEELKKCFKKMYKIKNNENRALNKIRETIAHRHSQADTQLQTIENMDMEYLNRLNLKIVDCLIEYLNITNQIINVLIKKLREAL